MPSFEHYRTQTGQPYLSFLVTNFDIVPTEAYLREPFIDWTGNTLSGIEQEASPVAKILPKDTGALLGWLYIWKNGDLSPLWIGTESSLFRLEVSLLKCGDILLTKHDIARIVSWTSNGR